MEVDTGSLIDPVSLLPANAIAHIFSFLPPEDVGRCALVSKAWAAATSDPCIWQIFLGETVVTDADAVANPGGWKGLFVHLFRSNLVQFPKFEDLARTEDGVRAWRKAGDLELESPPVGTPMCPANVPGDTMIATSHTRGSVWQDIDLAHLPEGFLDSCTNPILASAWYGCRIDCGSVFWLRLDLIDASGMVLRAYNSGELSAPPNTWRHAQYLVEDYPAGVRRMRVSLTGKDTHFWAGYYGAKFGPVEVRFVRPCEAARLQLPHMAERAPHEEYDPYASDENDFFEDEEEEEEEGDDDEEEDDEETDGDGDTDEEEGHSAFR